MRLRPALTLLFLALSCGGDAAPQANTVQVGIEDQGRTLELNAGDRLVISLVEGSSQPDAYRWELGAFPEEALDLISSDEDAARFEFTATGEGTGQVQLTGRPRCGRGLTGSEDDIECPVLGAGGAPLRLFVITLRVTG